MSASNIELPLCPVCRGVGIVAPVKVGDKISQLVVIPVYYTSVEIVDSLSESDRGNNGFGSTGR